MCSCAIMVQPSRFWETCSPWSCGQAGPSVAGLCKADIVQYMPGILGFGGVRPEIELFAAWWSIKCQCCKGSMALDKYANVCKTANGYAIVQRRDIIVHND